MPSAVPAPDQHHQSPADLGRQIGRNAPHGLPPAALTEALRAEIVRAIPTFDRASGRTTRMAKWWVLVAVLLVAMIPLFDSESQAWSETSIYLFTAAVLFAVLVHVIRRRRIIAEVFQLRRAAFTAAWAEANRR